MHKSTATVAAFAVLAFVALACATLPKPPDSIESTIKTLRTACAAVGEPDLDACAKRLLSEAKKK